MNIEKLNPEIVFKDYKYGRFNLLDGKFRIKEDLNFFILWDFFSKPSKIGTCDGQTETFVQNSDEQLYRVEGHEPLFFSSGDATHYFAVNFGEKVPLKVRLFGEEKRKKFAKKFAEEKNPIIYDPSFKKIIKYSESNYSITDLILEKFDSKSVLLFDKSRSLKKPDLSAPLGFSRDGQVVGVTCYKNKLIYTLSKPKRHPLSCGVEDVEALKQNMLYDSDLGAIVDMVHNKYVTREKVLK